MATKPMKSWEEIVKAAHKVASVNGTDNVDRVEAFLLACAIVYFDVAIKDGGTKLPASWRGAAVHAAGYETAAKCPRCPHAPHAKGVPCMKRDEDTPLGCLCEGGEAVR